MAHPINDMLSTTMQRLREMMDANTIVGTPIEAGGVTIIPVSKISIGYGTGGSDFAQKNQKPDNPNAFGGGAGMGVNIIPIAFLTIKDGNVRVLSVDQPASSTADRIVELVPEVIDRVDGFVNKKKKQEPEPDLLS